MKTKNKMMLLATLTMALSFSAYAKNDHNHGNGHGRDDRDDHEVPLIVGSKHGRDGSLTLHSKAGQVKTVNFKGVVRVPETVRVNAALLREGLSQVILTFDNRIQCTYQTRLTRKFFNAYYGLSNCSDGSRAHDDIKVDSSVSILLKDAKGFPATVYASLKIVEKFLSGLKFPDLDVSEGQILRYDGELWVPSNYIPDGQATGDVLLWDGANWTASKINTGGGSGQQGPAGPQGPAGIQGEKGEKGDVGPQGLTGEAGAVGSQGPAGAKGDTGAVGPAGAQGLAGAKGDKGDTGAVGPAGAAGAIGPQGLAGDKGDKGDKGETGDAGLVSLTAGNGIVGTTILGNGGTIAVNTGTAAGQIPVIGADGKLASSIMPYAQQKIAFLKDLKASGTPGGTCDATKVNWEQTRDLNNISGDQSFISLSSNLFTLDAGTYVIEAEAPAYLDGNHKAILANAATGAIILVGSNAKSHTNAGGMEPSKVMGQITLTTQTTFAIKHRCQTTMPNVGFGNFANFGVEEVYTQVKITKVK